VDVLRYRAAHQPDVRAYTFLVDGDAEEAVVTYGELDRKARAIAVALREQAAVGDRALLMFPSSLECIAAFFGCLYAGVIAVPIYPPRSNHHLRRLRAVAEDAGARVVLTDRASSRKIQDAMAGDAALAACRVLATDAVALGGADSWSPPPLGEEDIAFLQFTSGCTAAPKGVMVMHGNLMANEAAIAAGAPPAADTVIVSWLPMFHDMGLIGGVLYPLYNGVPAVLMGPTHFLQDPMRWLRAISRYRGTGSPAPNFAFELSLKAATPEALAALDLSSWRTAWNGGEPVRAETLRRFDETFGPCGLRRELHYPCYGLAESTLLVSGGRVDALPVIAEVDGAALEQGRVVTPAGGATRRIVGCGMPIGGRVRIVHPETRRARAPNEVGEIWVSGPSVAAGYWRRPEESEQTFGARLADTGDGPYMRTGDFGFLNPDGELFVTGRRKDVIIIRGRNIYPQDVELAIERVVPFVRANACAVFGVEVGGEEVVAAVVETDRAFARQITSAADGALPAVVEELTARMRDAVAQEFEVTLHTIAFVKPGGFPRTSSGKVQRAACRLGLTRGDLETLHVSRPAVRSAAIDPGAAPTDMARRIHDAVVQWARRTLERPATPIPHDLPLTALGADSLAAAALAADLERLLGCHLPLAVLFDLPTIRALADYVESGALARRNAERTPAPSAPSAPTASTPAEGGAARGLVRYTARNHRLTQLKASGRYFYETPISEQSDAWAVVDGRRMLMLGSYSYLGLLGHPHIEAAVKRAIKQFGSGHHGARLTAGTTTIHRDLERLAANVLNADDAIAFSTGFTANAATIAALLDEGDCVIGDEWNHASIVDGCRLSGATFLTYRHADMDSLEARLRQAGGRHTLVVVDSVFGMDGEIVDLPQVVALCRRYGALLMVDEAHSLGVLGPRGRGVQEYFGLPADAIDVKMATLSKAVPSSGGVVAGRQELIDFIRHNARGYVFSGGLTAMSAAAALAGLELLDREPDRVARLWQNVARYHRGLTALGFDTGRSSTPIVPVLCPDEAAAMEMTRFCREDGLYVVPVVFPAVPMNAARLRTCVMASHTNRDIDVALEVLARAGRRVGLIR
jgi:8-amino-7-oxononanoate synthase